jgi:LacI family transcriptional regulator
MNNHPSVSAPIRQAVLEAIDELHYQPNAIARTLRTAKTRTLGLLVPNMRNSEVASSAIQGAEAAAQDLGYALFVGDMRRDPLIEERSLRSLIERRVDGVLINPTMSFTTARDLLTESGTPAVVYGQPAPAPPLPTTVLSFSAAINEAIDHLTALGHRHIGTITHVSDVVLDVEVGWGPGFIQRALRARGIDQAERLDRVARSLDECTGLVRDLLAGTPRPTALFVTPMYLVPATLTGIRAAGVRVPDDVSLIGLGDSDWARVVDPPLSVIAADLSAHLEASVRLLVNLVERHDRPVPCIEHHATYTRRDSVALPR